MLVCGLSHCPDAHTHTREYTSYLYQRVPRQLTPQTCARLNISGKVKERVCSADCFAGVSLTLLSVAGMQQHRLNSDRAIHEGRKVAAFVEVKAASSWRHRNVGGDGDSDGEKVASGCLWAVVAAEPCLPNGENAWRKSTAVARDAPIEAITVWLSLHNIMSTILVRSSAVPPHLESVTKLSGVGRRTSYWACMWKSTWWVYKQ